MTDPARKASGLSSRLMARSERYAPAIFLMPTVLVVLFASVFPLIVSLYLSFSRFRFVKGGHCQTNDNQVEFVILAFP